MPNNINSIMNKKGFGKKGSIELSMTTIIVIIIGITLLSLGLIWVRGTFSKVTDLSEGAFEKAEGAISDIFEEVDKPVYVSPPSLSLEQETSEIAQFIITNFEQEPIKVSAFVKSSDPTLECLFADTLQTQSKEYSLNSGKQVKIKLIVEEKGGALGTKVCNLEVPSMKESNTESLIIEVVKKQGLFN